MTQHVRADDCLRNFSDIEGLVEGALENKIEQDRASQEDRYLDTVGGVEVQDKREVLLRSSGG